jgi:uncharacterized UPF0160 family protein
MKVATHDGSFHADDVFAVAALRLLHPGLEVVRSRDRDVLAHADVRVDVGLRSDPASGDFDHHQREGAGRRESAIPYASFGLVWREHGAALCGGDPRAAADVDRFLVQGVDAIDTGFSLTKTLHDGARPADVSDLVDAFNPAWDEDAGADDRSERFEAAVVFAQGVIERAVARARAGARARGLVEEAIAGAVDPRVIVLERSMPWHETVVTGAPEALYVVYTKGPDDWRVQSVPRELGSFVNRKDLPAAWAGLQAGELAQVTRSRAGILELVRQALGA